MTAITEQFLEERFQNRASALWQLVLKIPDVEADFYEHRDKGIRIDSIKYSNVVIGSDKDTSLLIYTSELADGAQPLLAFAYLDHESGDNRLLTERLPENVMGMLKYPAKSEQYTGQDIAMLKSGLVQEDYSIAQTCARSSHIADPNDQGVSHIDILDITFPYNYFNSINSALFMLSSAALRNSNGAIIIHSPKAMERLGKPANEEYWGPNIPSDLIASLRPLGEESIIQL